MAKYVIGKDKGSADHLAWHWCRNCPDWPKEIAETAEHPNGTLCPLCIKLGQDGQCSGSG